MTDVNDSNPLGLATHQVAGAVATDVRYDPATKRVKVNGQWMLASDLKMRMLRRVGIELDSRQRLLVCPACGEAFICKLPMKFVKKLAEGKEVPDADIRFSGVGPRRKERHCKRVKCKRDRQLAYQRAWRAKNPEKASAANLAWKAKNPERKRAACRAWKAKNPEKLNAANLAWKAKNREKLNAYRRARYAAKKLQCAEKAP